MYAGLAIIIYFLVRGVQNSRKNASPATPRRRQRSQGFYRVLLWWLIAPSIGLTAFIFAVTGSYPAWLLVVGITAGTFPWWTARHVLAPLRLPRLAGELTRLFSLVLWSRDEWGGAATAAAWSLLFVKGPRPRTEATIERWLTRQRPVLAGGLIARALLAVRQGDLESARRLMEGVSGLDPRAASYISRRLANEWLVLDAAERGDWTRAAELANRKDSQTRVTLFIRMVARRFVDPSEMPAGAVVLYWLIAPRRLRTWPLMRRACATSRRPEPDRAAEALPEEPLSRALALHVGALKADREVSAEGFREMGLAWDSALADPSTATQLLRRAAELQVAQPGDLTGRLRTSAADDLASIVRTSGIDWGEVGASGDVLGFAGSEAREALLGEVEIAADRLSRRVEDQRDLPVIDEWQEYAQIKLAYERVGKTGGVTLQRSVFDRVHTSVCGLAVRLFNVRGEKPLANAMMRWLLAEAQAVGDAEAIRLQTKNVGLGCGV